MVMNGKDLLIEIIIKGVFVEGENHFYTDLKNSKLRRYKRFDFFLNGFRYSTYMEEKKETPFWYRDKKIYYNMSLLEGISIERIENEEWGSEKSWYIKSWNRDDNMPYELRLNPINICSNLRYTTGENGEFKGCAFCHRVYNYSRYGEENKIKTVKGIFEEIYEQEGRELLHKIKKILIMTGNMETPEQVINLCNEVYQIVHVEGYKGVVSISTNQICDEDDLRDLAAIDNTFFEYTLEMFERRQCLMGEKKGYDMYKVIQTLKLARRYFKHIRINYIVGLDSIGILKKKFLELKKLGVVDDLIPSVFVPYTPEMKKIRNVEAERIEYYKEARHFFEEIGLVPKKNGLTKNLFLEDVLDNSEMDKIME